jgi:diguanylate cyclase (GGDEF)-like protein/PAS domain S-box-containing protein
MADRTELLETALDSLPEGIALVDGEGHVVFWNRAAEAITGYASMDMLAQPVPAALDPLLLAGPMPKGYGPSAKPRGGHSVPVHFDHKLGHSVPAMVRVVVLRDELGERMGSAVVFHPAENLNALPHGGCDEGSSMEASQAEFEDRLETVFEDFRQGGQAFSVLWITVDQAHALRKTHGAGACDAMLAKVERVLTNGLRPAEEMGRWGDDEFLILSHECTPKVLAAHAQVLAGLARTADFRWWGDRVSLTVSIGVAQAKQDETLAQLLARAQAAMLSSVYAGGNHITPASGE